MKFSWLFMLCLLSKSRLATLKSLTYWTVFPFLRTKYHFFPHLCYCFPLISISENINFSFLRVSYKFHFSWSLFSVCLTDYWVLLSLSWNFFSENFCFSAFIFFIVHASLRFEKFRFKLVQWWREPLAKEEVAQKNQVYIRSALCRELQQKEFKH